MIFAWFFLYEQLCELTLRWLRVEWHHHFRSHSPPTGHSGHALLHLMTWTHAYMYLQNRSGPGCWLVNTDLHLNLTPSLMGGLNGRVLGGARDGRLCHDRVGVGWFVHGFELQTLMMDPEIRWFQVFRRALVLVGAGVGLTGCTLPENTNTTEHWTGFHRKINWSCSLKHKVSVFLEGSWGIIVRLFYSVNHSERWTVRWFSSDWKVIHNCVVSGLRTLYRW